MASASAQPATDDGVQPIVNVYEDMTREYEWSKQLPWRRLIERPTLLALLGDIQGRRILDLACGQGIYTRLFKQLGAGYVLGVDLSPKMIELARQRDAEERVACDYVVGDAQRVGRLGAFDLVVGVYLLNYAQTRESLTAFCRTIYQNLKPGGRFVGINNNPYDPVELYATYKPYGFWKEIASRPQREGDPIRHYFSLPDGSHFTFDNYYLSPQTHAEAFADAGLVDFEWRPHIVEDPEQEYDPAYWDAFMKGPPTIGITARRGDGGNDGCERQPGPVGRR